ncbi:f-box-like wd repeat-containing protein tbl1xr1-like [Lichtheimia corymbifera JMRC:FSU:9682]|uniref:F-box-like wd repeat-containing protein tbl1xr1-like n=1 Tax=Lichtheimia corymbifera JMRC:FSU:9682 TaxID=1263082 RepID=A0A068S0D1_9FUNG|nr:f-box-like wd repeat-containing protein tbl1xr1-like [Lichtheimia corymbifera JMRC:FSU:9682]
MTLTSDQVNIIVYRYLQESGFRHTSFAFQHESQVQNSAYRDTEIQAGALINIIHKGLQFMDIEAHMNEDGELMECNIPFSLLEPHHCDLTGKTLSDSHTSSSPTPGAKRQRKDKSQKEKEKRVRRDTSNDEISSAVATAAATTTTPSAAPSSSSSSAPTNSNTDAAAPVNGYTIKEETETADVEMRDVQPATTTTTTTTEQVAKPQTMVDPKDVHVLTGHQSEVFSCSWNPVEPLLLASGSGDATARLWRIPEDSSKTAEPPIVLSHLPNLNENKDVTTLDWNPSGTLLATGSYDGQARIWTLKGELRFLMAQHRGPIFSLKWNGKGDLILSGSADNTTVVWDPETGEMKQQYELHSLAILDVDWMDNTTFASCSSDKTIFVCRVGETEPLKKWAGHEDEVNAVRWDPTGQYLASCSDDMTTKIWSLSSDQPVQEIRGHSLQIYTLQWAPYSRSTSTESSSPRILATASFDATVRLWDALNGTCLHVLQNHSEAVYSISFSPDARLLATGSFDEQLNVWNAKDGTLQETFKANGGIFEVHFNKNGDKLAACTSNKQVVILDMKR